MAPKSDKFIASEDDDSDAVATSDEEYGKKKKKAVKKQVKDEDVEEDESKLKRKVKDEDEDEDEDEEEEKPKKKSKSSPSSSSLQKNLEGDSYLPLSLGSSSRRATIRKFKNSILIDIRETYEKDGKEGLPGKKGISLTAEQWKTLRDNAGLIDEAISLLK